MCDDKVRLAGADHCGKESRSRDLRFSPVLDKTPPRHHGHCTEQWLTHGAWWLSSSSWPPSSAGSSSCLLSTPACSTSTASTRRTLPRARLSSRTSAWTSWGRASERADTRVEVAAPETQHTGGWMRYFWSCSKYFLCCLNHTFRFRHRSPGLSSSSYSCQSPRSSSRSRTPSEMSSENFITIVPTKQHKEVKIAETKIYIDTE